MTSVYVIAAEGSLTKVGLATNIKSRLENIRSNSPLPLRLVYLHEARCAYHAAAIERSAFALLEEHRSHGSWFSVPVEAAVVAVRQAALNPHQIRLSGHLGRRGAVLTREREVAGLSPEQLASLAGVSVDAVLAAENGWAHSTLQDQLRGALQAAGVIFIDQNGGGPGVRLRDPLP